MQREDGWGASNAAIPFRVTPQPGKTKDLKRREERGGREPLAFVPPPPIRLIQKARGRGGGGRDRRTEPRRIFPPCQGEERSEIQVPKRSILWSHSRKGDGQEKGTSFYDGGMEAYYAVSSKWFIRARLEKKKEGHSQLAKIVSWSWKDIGGGERKGKNLSFGIGSVGKQTCPFCTFPVPPALSVSLCRLDPSSPPISSQPSVALSPAQCPPSNCHPEFSSPCFRCQRWRRYVSIKKCVRTDGRKEFPRGLRQSRRREKQGRSKCAFSLFYVYKNICILLRTFLSW